MKKSYKALYLESQKQYEYSKQRNFELLGENRFLKNKIRLSSTELAIERVRTTGSVMPLTEAEERLNVLRGAYRQLEENYKNLLIATDKELSEHRFKSKEALF